MSNYQDLTAIRKVIEPLALREPALCDKDASWGISDLSEEEKRQRKKDSGYGEWTSPISRTHTLKRVASTNTHMTSTPCPAFKPFISVKGAVNGPSRHRVDAAEMYASNGRRNSTPTSMNHQTMAHAPPALAARFCGGRTVYNMLPRSKLLSSSSPSLLPIDPDDTFNVLTSISAKYIAEQLTFVEQELFCRIQPRDFLRYLWAPSTARKDSNPVLESIENFNFVSGWISSVIVDQVNIEKRVLMFEVCLKIAVELHAMRNFNTLMAVMAGINSAAVLRLKQTRILIKLKNKRLFDQFLGLETLMGPERYVYIYIYILLA